MGKKGSWFSAIIRLFTPNSSKDKQANGTKRKKWKQGRGVVTHGESKSYFPLCREASSIEKILGEADEHRRQRRELVPDEKPRLSSGRKTPSSPSRPPPPGASSSSKVSWQRPEVNGYVHRPAAEPTRNALQVSAAIRIQAAFRGYMARRGFRALRGLVRLEGVMRGQNVEKQVLNAMKQMQFMVRIQTQIHHRRIKMLESQARDLNNDMDGECTLPNWTPSTRAGIPENWDGSMLTKDEIEQRGRRKADAVINRERAMAYAYSNQLWKGNKLRWSGYPSVWWNWLNHSQPDIKNIHRTPPRAPSGSKPSPHFPATPSSTKSAVPMRTKDFNTSTSSPFHYPLADDDSLTSCPPFPSYMAPTASAKAKARRPFNYTRERNDHFTGGTSSNDSKRRFSFPLTPNSNAGSSFRSNKESSKDATPKSVDSTVSMPAIVGRKPFNRFV
ncbi:unnamed protein product [Cuscuta epithymum]|uniref:DUF4005 domain-containing protein n=1 Tax=Cuscuta epithymum TaxID=186058 RepID=A0AAV0CTL9_9ASTE|nr:unnamed protein product [Cuscuta epithymum]